MNIDEIQLLYNFSSQVLKVTCSSAVRNLNLTAKNYSAFELTLDSYKDRIVRTNTFKQRSFVDIFDKFSTFFKF